MALTIRRPWTTQPQVSTGLDPRWVARKLVYASTVVDLRDRVSGRAETLLSSPSTEIVGGRTGRLRRWSSVAQQAVVTRLTTGSSVRTILLRVLRTGDSPDTFGRLWDSNGEDLLFDDPTGGETQYFRTFTGGLAQYRFGRTPLDTECVIALRQDVGNLGAPSFFINGIEQARTTDVGPSGSAVLTSAAYHLGNRTSLDRNINGAIADFIVFDALLTDSEIRELSRNTHQIYAPLTRRIWVPASAGGTSHAASGALAAQAAAVAGVALHPHTSTGALAAQAASVAGAALHPHTSTGALSAQDATVTGAALHPHTSTGALTAQNATVAGAALHPHTSTGALASQDSTVAGTAAHLTLHTSTGALSADAASVAGVAVHGKDASGVLSSQDSTVAGAAVHLTLHAATGDLAAGDATVAGAVLHPHTSTGALAAGDATVSGDAVLASITHEATGNLSAQAAAVVGAAQRFAFHEAIGALVAGDASVTGEVTGPAVVSSGGGGWGGRRDRWKERDPKAEREREAERELLAMLAADDEMILALLQEQIDAGVFDQPGNTQ
jgi:hypothetical protein